MKALPSKRSVFRVARRVLVTAAVLWLVYLVAANAIGRSAWLQGKLAADPQAQQIAFTDFWTVVPGNFHLRNLRATFQYQTGTQIHVEGDRVEVDFALAPLLLRRVVAKQLVIDGFAYQERDASNPLQGDPEIASTEPLDTGKAPPALWYDEAKAGWLLRIDDLHLHARELWFYPFRYRGDATVTGAVRLRPNRELAFEHLRFELGTGTGDLAGGPALSELHGSVEGTMEPISPSELRDPAVLHSLTVTTSLAADVEDAAFVNRFIDRRTAIIAGKGGRMSIAATMDHGRLAAPGNAWASIDSLWVNVGGVAIEGRVHVSASSRVGPTGVTTSVTAAVDTGALHDATMATLATANGTTFFAALDPIDFADPGATKVAWNAQAPAIRVDDARHFDHLLAPHAARFLSGSALVRGTAHGELGGPLGGHVWVSSDQVTFVRGDATYTGKLSAGTDFARESDGADLTLAHAFAYLDDGAVARDGASTAWWGHVDVASARVRAKDSAFVGAAHVRVRDLEPVFAAVEALHGIPGWLHRAAALYPWDAQLEGTFGEHVELRSFEALAGEPGHERARVRMTYDDTVKDAEHLRVAVDLGALAVGVEKHGKGVDVVLSDVEGWYQRTAPRPLPVR